MLLPQVIKRLIYPHRPGKVRTDARHPPGADQTPARSGEEVLEKAVETQKRAGLETTSPSGSAPPPRSRR